MDQNKVFESVEEWARSVADRYEVVRCGPDTNEYTDYGPFAEVGIAFRVRDDASDDDALATLSRAARDITTLDPSNPDENGLFRMKVSGAVQELHGKPRLRARLDVHRARS